MECSSRWAASSSRGSIRRPAALEARCPVDKNAIGLHHAQRRGEIPSRNGEPLPHPVMGGAEDHE